MINYQIFTDGSCRANGIGGVGLVWLKNGEKVFEYSKRFEGVTNNIMELTAIYAALKSIKKEINSLEIISDSEYSIGVITKPWNPKKNVSLIEKIKKQLIETQKFVKEPIKWTHVKGHADNEFNNRADFLATKESSYI